MKSCWEGGSVCELLWASGFKNRQPPARLCPVAPPSAPKWKGPPASLALASHPPFNVARLCVRACACVRVCVCWRPGEVPL